MAGSGSPSATAAALAAIEVRDSVSIAIIILIYSQSEVRQKGAPYTPLHAALGSPPSPNPDIPIAAVFLAIYIICGTLNLMLLIQNKKRGMRFQLSMPQASRAPSVP